MQRIRLSKRAKEVLVLISRVLCLDVCSQDDGPVIARELLRYGLAEQHPQYRGWLLLTDTGQAYLEYLTDHKLVPR